MQKGRNDMGQQVAVRQNTGRRKRSGVTGREQAELMLIMLPTFVLIFIFCYIPLYGIVIAFQNYTPGSPFLAFDGSVEWVGLKHFADFISSRTFFRLIRNTLVLSGLNLVFGFTMPILFALFLNEVQNARFKKVMQTASYLPYFISSVVVAGMVLSFIDTNGVINVLRNMAGLPSVAYSGGRRRVSCHLYRYQCVEILWMGQLTLSLRHVVHRCGAL